jgi:hypothetical protein
MSMGFAVPARGDGAVSAAGTESALDDVLDADLGDFSDDDDSNTFNFDVNDDMQVVEQPRKPRLAQPWALQVPKAGSAVVTATVGGAERPHGVLAGTPRLLSADLGQA